MRNLSRGFSNFFETMNFPKFKAKKSNVQSFNCYKGAKIDGDYIILRIQYDSVKFDYKLAYVDYIKYGKVIFNIQGINVLRTPIKVTDFCILPDYISNNFYKINNK